MDKVQMFLGIVIAIMMFGFVAGALLMSLGSFKDSMTANSAEANATGNIIDFAGNFAAKLPTVGTILGVLLLVVVIIGVLAGGYIAYQRYA